VAAHNYGIEPATQDHVAAMLPYVRKADRDEVFASSGSAMEVILPICVGSAREAWAGLVDGQVACIFGVNGRTILSEVGVPWMIGTDLIAKHAKAFLRRNKKMVAVMLSLYPTLINYVDVRNVKAIEWLRWLGFVFDDPAPHGVYQMPFLRFEMKADHV
jgi:hypothetical protein